MKHMRLVTALGAGALFGFGLSLSGMLDPARVLGFLNLGGPAWDPSLAFVLGGAVLAALPGVLLQRRLARPLLEERFHLPGKQRIDRPLLAGAALFGIGWGLAGICPGPAITALTLGLPGILLFVAALLAGMLLHDRV